MGTTTNLPTSGSCPRWCDGDHRGRPWHFGAQPVTVSNGATSATLLNLFLSDGGGEPTSISIGDSDYVLSPAQAHELGMALLRSADAMTRSVVTR